MKKIKCLVIASDRSGVSMFRSIDPHLKLEELFPGEFHIDIVTAGTDTFDWDNENWYKNYDIIHYHRALPQIKNGQIQPAYGEDADVLFKKLKKHNIKLILDLDDYWMVSQDHPAYYHVKTGNLDKHIIHNIINSDYVTTTTSLYAKEIGKYNKNVIVLPNAIDPSQQQFQSNPEPTTKKLRVGWLGGSSHLKDLELAGSSVSMFLGKHKEDTQFVLCGFDLRGNITELDPETKQPKTRKIRPEESVWVRYEELFTSNYKLTNIDYQKELKKYINDNNLGVNENYRRVWTKPITTYAQNYNLFDVSLAPVKEHMFNQCKSQLKVIEAGFHKKALIATDFGPYKIDLISGYNRGGSFNDKGNALLVDSHRNHKDWGKYLNFLYENPDVIKQLGENLYESVQKYHIDVVTTTRSEVYKTIMEDKEKEIKNLIQEVNEI